MADGKSTGTRAGGKRKAAAAPIKASVEDLQKYYRDMLLIRRFEEKAGQMYGMGLIGGFCHLYIGQEAVVVGVQADMGPEDTVLTSYRDHAHMLACGMDPKGVMAELTRRARSADRRVGKEVVRTCRARVAAEP